MAIEDTTNSDIKLLREQDSRAFFSGFEKAVPVGLRVAIILFFFY